MATTLTLIFTLGDELYGLEIDAVQEIVENPALHCAPGAEGVIRGAINFHGQILAAIDLPALLGYPGLERDRRQVVLTGAYKSLALSVSAIQHIADLDLSALKTPPESGRERAIRAMAALDQTTINLLDTDEIFKRLENLYAH